MNAGNLLCFLIISFVCACFVWISITGVINSIGTPCDENRCQFRTALGGALILGLISIIFIYVAFEKFIQEKEKTLIG